MIILRDAPSDLLCIRHARPHLRCGVAAPFPLGGQDQSPQPAQELPSPSVDSESRGAHSGRVAVTASISVASPVPPGRNFPPSGARIPRLAQYKVTGTGSNDLASGPLRGNGEWCPFHFYPLTPGPTTPGCRRNSIPYRMLTQNTGGLLQSLPKPGNRCHQLAP